MTGFIIDQITMYLGSNRFFNNFGINDRPIFFLKLRIKTVFFNERENDSCFLMKGKMIAEFQDAGKTPDKK